MLEKLIRSLLIFFHAATDPQKNACVKQILKRTCKVRCKFSVAKIF